MSKVVQSQNKNILLWKFTHLHSSIQNYLTDDVTVKVWIDKAKYSTTTHNINLFYRNLPLQKKREGLLIDYQYREEFLQIYQELRQFSEEFMYIYSRHPGLNGENNFMDMMDAFHIYIHYFIDLLMTNHIHCVFFNSIPHHADYVLYLVARALNIKTVMFFPAPELGRSFLLRDINDLGSIDSNRPVRPFPIKRRERKSYSYMEDIPKQHLYKKLISAALFRQDSDLFFHRLMNIRKERIFRRNYKKMAVEDIPTDKFVYFPLHLQPELTTQRLGGVFVDQMLAIECLRVLIPDEWKIVVKENPKQTHHARSSLFFARLSKIPNVIYMRKEVNTFNLIEKSEFCATVTGTVGFEALAFGKRVLFFGHAIYKNLPGTIQYKDDLTFNDVMSVEFTHAELELTYARLVDKMVDVVFSQEYATLVKDFSEEQNTRKLAEIIHQIVRE